MATSFGGLLRTATFVPAIASGLLGLCGGASAQTPLLPSALAYDAQGNLYYADTNRNQVYELSAQGVLQVFAGSSTQGRAGDGGPATSANLNAPQGIAVASDGTVYIADTGNQRIRAVVNGVIATFAGTGVAGFGGDNASASTAQLNHPTAIAIDAQGGVLICDTNNNRIRRISGGIITTIAGTGVQGFVGDGGSATAAQLNAPMGIAVDGANRILVADTLNQRVRSISASGTIATLAGTGVAGYSGDSGLATQARLSQPSSLAVDTAGDILIADVGNERIRSVNAAGTITTIAGTGAQGLTADGVTATAAALNRPMGLTVSSAGNIVFSDADNQRVRMVDANAEIITLVPVGSLGGSQTTLTMSPEAVYGQASATASVTTSGSVPATGIMLVLEGTRVVAQSTLTGGSAHVSLASLGVGMHQLNASYAGDAHNAASSSPAESVQITTAAVVATSSAATMFYGQTPPLLTGTSTGILAQDAASTIVSFSTAATSSSTAGSYPITAALTGPASADYTLTMSAASAPLTVAPATTAISLTSSTGPSYLGFPLLLTASLSAKTPTPTSPSGQVQFYDGSTLLAQATTVNGVATATYTPPASATHAFTATFGGSQNFAASTSPAVAVTTSALPDFSMVAATASQTVQGGSVASYALNLASTGGTFTGIVGFAVSGLPTGATATFTPSLVVPGVTGVTTTLSVQTTALTAAARTGSERPALLAFCVGCLGMLFSRRRRKLMFSVVCCTLLLSGMLTLTGCGARTIESVVAPTATSQLVVTATSTNLAGSVVTHTTSLTLNIH